MAHGKINYTLTAKDPKQDFWDSVRPESGGLESGGLDSRATDFGSELTLLAV